MSTKVRAYSIEDAKRQINDRLNFISIEDITEPDFSSDDMLNNIKNLFGIK